MSSIRMQTQVGILEIEVTRLKEQLHEFQQVVDALTSIVEKRAKEGEEDRALVQKLMEHVGALTMKGSTHGKVRGAAVRKDKGTTQASIG
jgi:predicted lipoprotein